MGDPRKLHKRFSRPKKPYSKTRIEEERKLIKEYGLKNKREIWKAAAYIDRIRNQAKKLILDPEKQQIFLNKIKNIGLIKENSTLDDVLALTKEALLERRLQTIVFRKNLANTPKQARQFITHRKIKVNEKVVNVPGYIVRSEEEKLIKLKEEVKTKPKEQEKSIEQEAKEIEEKQEKQNEKGKRNKIRNRNEE